MEKTANKAYRVTVMPLKETVIFAENQKTARKIAPKLSICKNVRFIDIKIRRFPEADFLYKGSYEVNMDTDKEKLKELGLHV